MVDRYSIKLWVAAVEIAIVAIVFILLLPVSNLSTLLFIPLGLLVGIVLWVFNYYIGYKL